MDNNFIFNMDNARDMVDVREMVVSHKLRLIGPTTSIDGVYFGPFWYYMLAIPFLITGGNPYGSIILEIILWAIGGYFLLSLTNKYYGKLAFYSVALIWFASNFIILGIQYAFNPNPVLFLTPVFIYSLLEFIETEKLRYSLLTWFLAGAFFHFIVPVGIFMPAIIFIALFFIKRKLIRTKELYFGLVIFILTFLPQFVFDLRHSFFMLRSLFEYHSTSHGGLVQSLPVRILGVLKSFYDTMLPTFMNFKSFTTSVSIILFGILIFLIKTKKSVDRLTFIALLLVFVPLIGLIPLKVDIMRWYLNASMVAVIILVGFIISFLEKNKFGKVIAIALVFSLTIFSLQNISSYIKDAKGANPGNSILKNEISAVDYVYQQSGGKNFKVYTYLPSVYDWPYQYLFWWRGLNKYGFLPEEYSYLPNKPDYVTGKKNLKGGGNPTSSGLVFLIKEPDQIHQRDLWENEFKNLPLLETEQIGVLTIETRKEVTK